VLDVLEAVFVAIFDGINEKCVKHLEAINAQYPFEPLQVGVLCMCLLRILIYTAWFFCINMHKGFCLFYPGCNENFEGEFFFESEHV